MLTVYNDIRLTNEYRVQRCWVYDISSQKKAVDGRKVWDQKIPGSHTFYNDTQFIPSICIIVKPWYGLHHYWGKVITQSDADALSCPTYLPFPKWVPQSGLWHAESRGNNPHVLSSYFRFSRRSNAPFQHFAINMLCCRRLAGIR